MNEGTQLRPSHNTGMSSSLAWLDAMRRLPREPSFVKFAVMAVSLSCAAVVACFALFGVMVHRTQGKGD